MIEDRVTQMIDEMRMSLEARKLTLEQYMQYSGIDMKQLRERQHDAAVENVKTDLVLDAIAKAENIQVSMEDVDSELPLLLPSMAQLLKTLRKSLNPMALWACCSQTFCAAKLPM